MSNKICKKKKKSLISKFLLQRTHWPAGWLSVHPDIELDEGNKPHFKPVNHQCDLTKYCKAILILEVQDLICQNEVFKCTTVDR